MLAFCLSRPNQLVVQASFQAMLTLPGLLGMVQE